MGLSGAVSLYLKLDGVCYGVLSSKSTGMRGMMAVGVDLAAVV